MADPKEQPIEKALERLEAIVAKMEAGEAGLEKSIDLYEEGRRLAKECQERLEKLEKRVQLVRERTDGTLETEDFEPGAGD